jgi:hypothetical protein
MVNSNRDLSFTSAEKAILTTILYSDIFSFPFTREELWKFLLSKRKITRTEFDAGLESLKEIISKDGYFCLKDRESIISRRQKNITESAKKMKQARNVTQKLAVIPSILFIGVSGGLAVGNAEEKDDIDLVIIAKKNTLFVTRFFVLSILQGLGMRRTRSQKKAANTICVNLLFDETAIAWFGERKDVYIAREIVQIVPLFQREDMYRKLLYANSWIQQFLPNTSKKMSFLSEQKSENVLISKIFFNPLAETVFRILQIQWMRRHQTNEVITEHLLAFHPNDYRISTLKQLRLKMRQFGLLTKF